MQVDRLVVGTRWFEIVMGFVIIIAGIVVGLSTVEWQDKWIWTSIEVVEWIIIAVFTVEALLKLFSVGIQLRRYFSDGWNVFDLVIVIACYLPWGGSLVAVLRLARLLRLLKLVRIVPQLQIIVTALLKGFTSIMCVLHVCPLLPRHRCDPEYATVMQSRGCDALNIAHIISFMRNFMRT